MRTFYEKQINAKKYEWEFGSVLLLLVCDCINMVLNLELRTYVLSVNTSTNFGICYPETEVIGIEPGGLELRLGLVAGP